MTQRTSLIEQYNNRDVIAQIYRLISLVESSTIVRTTSVQEGSTVTVTFEMFDGTTKQFTFTNNADMTTDTEQNVTALKNFLAGLNVTGNTQIDGETQIVNGHSLQVAGDLDIAGDTELAGRLTAHGQSEIAGMAIEESSGATVLSNANGIKSASPVTLSGDVVVPTTVTGQRDTEAVNGTRLQNDLDVYAPMLRTTGNQVSTGAKEGNWTMYRMVNPNGINNGKWLRYCEMDTSFSLTLMEFVGQRGNNGYCYARAIVGGTQTYGRIFPIDNVPCNSQIKIVGCLNRTTGKMEIWIYMNESISVREMAVYINQPDKRNAVYLNEEYDNPPTEADYAGLNYILGSA